MINIDLMLTRLTIVAQVTSGLGYIAFPPVYETGIWKVVVPVLGAVDLLIAHAVWKRRFWINPWLLPIGIGTLIVAVPFWGESSDFHGALAFPMLAVETSTIISAICLIALAFRPSFRSSHGKAG